MIIKEDVATKKCIVVTSSQKHSHRTSLIQLRPIFELSFRQKSNSLTKQQKQELNARRKSSSLASATSTSTKQLKSSDSNRRRIKRRHTVSGTKDIGKENLAVAIDLSKNLDGHDRRLSLPVWTKKVGASKYVVFWSWLGLPQEERNSLYFKPNNNSINSSPKADLYFGLR